MGSAVSSVLTVGHGTLSESDFASIVTAAGVVEVVDVRSFPGSRRNPQFGSDRMARWLPQHGVTYSWLRSLGGRRKLMPGSPHVALRHASFRAYADHMGSDSFLAGVTDLLDRGRDLAVMCSESVWWRCHRRLLADYLMLVRQIDVVHLMHDGRHMPHVPTDGVRRDGNGLVYDVVTAGAATSGRVDHRAEG
jgi:uncharacterized protein (DUF488 family)